MSTISNVSLINTRVSYHITRGQYLILYQFQCPMSHISSPKQHYELISRTRLNWHIDIDAITTEWWDQPIRVSSDFGRPLASALSILAISPVEVSTYLYGLCQVWPCDVSFYIYFCYYYLGKLSIISIPYHSINSVPLSHSIRTISPTHQNLENIKLA